LLAAGAFETLYWRWPRVLEQGKQIVAFARGFGAVTPRGKANSVRSLRGSLERGPDLLAWIGAEHEARLRYGKPAVRAPIGKKTSSDAEHFI
jgi:hypothetical protein